MFAGSQYREDKMNKVKLSSEAIAQAQGLIMSKSLADIALQKFLEGCKAGLGLNGDYNLDTRAWTFVKMPKKEGG